MREQFIRCTEQTVLGCSCGERVILIGRMRDWYAEERLPFTCECGKALTFADSLSADPAPLLHRLR